MVEFIRMWLYLVCLTVSNAHTHPGQLLVGHINCGRNIQLFSIQVTWTKGYTTIRKNLQVTNNTCNSQVFDHFWSTHRKLFKCNVGVCLAETRTLQQYPQIPDHRMRHRRRLAVDHEAVWSKFCDLLW